MSMLGGRAGRIGTACLALVATAACSGSTEAAPEPPPTPVVNTEVTLTAPEGNHVEQCWFPGTDPRRGLVVALVVPDSLFAAETTAEMCRLESLTKPWSHAASVEVGVTESLDRFRDRYVGPYVADGGDDAVNNVEQEDDATVFDGRHGATLSFDSFNDGEEKHQVLAQFEDVRVSWSVPTEGFPDTTYDDAEITTGIAGVQIVEDAPRPVRWL
jgi:hypothetical protein